MRGQIGAIAKLNTVATGDTLAVYPYPLWKTELSVPYTYKRYKTVNKGDEDKVSGAVQDDGGRFDFESSKRFPEYQSLLYGIGEQHLDLVVSKLKERYKVDIVLSEPGFLSNSSVKKQM